MLMELERLCCRKALSSAIGLQSEARLFLNTSAKALSDPELQAGKLKQIASEVGLKSQNIVLEITERVAIEKKEIFQKVLWAMKEQGFSLAIDDMGASYASLQTIAEVEPEFLKFDISLVRGIDKSLIKRELLEMLIILAEKIKAFIIAEGVETEAEFKTLKELGVTLGQGYYLGPPAKNLPSSS